MQEYLAKSHPVETLSEHTGRVCTAYDELMKLYGSEFTEKEKELIRIACEVHDYGKRNKIFQEIVNPKIKKKPKQKQMPHGFLSIVAIAYQLKDWLNEGKYSSAEISGLITAVYYHHDREDNYEPADIDEYIEEYMEEDAEKLYEEDINIMDCIDYKLYKNSETVPPVYVKEENKEIYKSYLNYLLIKGILNKLDYTASAHREHEVEQAYDVNIVQKITDKFGSSLTDAQKFMQENKDENIVVIAPTGSGKTEGALLWADTAKAFYTLPLKVSSNDIYRRISENYACKAAGLLHSDSIYTYFENSENGKKRENEEWVEQYRNAKNLSCPLTVCTVDQLFKFVFKAMGTEIFAATLKYSKVIIDEMQMYEPRIVAMLIYGLKIVTQMGGRFAIMTATLPPFILKMLEKEGISLKFKEFTNARNSDRHIAELVKSEEFDFEKIEKAGTEKKVLVICNTVAESQKAYQRLKDDGAEVRLLHARFIGKDRKKLEEDIKDFARSKEKTSGIWVTTQIVEASLDIDFDELFTQMCTADSLLQRMGRCYRSRNYDKNEPNIHIYDMGAFKIYDEKLYERSVEEIKPYLNKIFTEKEKQEYIKNVYDEEKIKNSEYYNEINKMLGAIENIPLNLYKKSDANELFRKIYSMNVIPDEVYEENLALIEECIEILGSKKSGFEEICRAEMQIRELTVPVSLYSKDAQFADRTPIKDTNIYRTRARYEFDEESLCGLGLIREEYEDPIW